MLIKLLNKGYIYVSSLLANALVLFVKKPRGGLRFYIDYKALNAIICLNYYLFLLIKKTLANLTKACWFIKLNMQAAFYKLYIVEENEWKIAFCIRFSLFK
jgi:hypothetical protein